MRNFHLALVAGASLLLALAGTANAHSGGGGGLGGGSGGGAPSSPPGFNSSGGHNGFELLDHQRRKLNAARTQRLGSRQG